MKKPVRMQPPNSMEHFLKPPVPGRRCPAGGLGVPLLRTAGASQEGGQDGQGKHKKCGADVAGSAECSDWIEGYAAAAFFAVFGCALTGGFGVAFFAVFAFSFAANSCLTVVVIAATSTL